MSFHLRLRLGLLTAAVLAWPTLAFPQSPGKPVPVRDEPNHKVTLENACLRLIDVHFSPGATSLYHIHTIPSVIIELADADIVTQELGAVPSAVRHVAPGDTRYAPYDEKSLTHRVTNAGISIFHVLDIELLRRSTDVVTPPPAPAPGLKIEWEQKLVRCYQLALGAGQQTEVKAGGCAHLLVGLAGTAQVGTGSDGAKSTHPLGAGEYLFFAPGSRLQIDNRGPDAAKCVLLELK